MGYTPLNASTHHAQPEQYDHIELHDRRYSSPDHTLYSPPAGPPPVAKNRDIRDPKAYFQSSQPPGPQWPHHSQRVGALTPLRVVIIVFDAILASTPIMFIALSLIAARLDGKEVSNYGLHLRQALLLSPTIFPVIFAALMGRCFKHIGLFLAERGTTLGRLEQLVGCQSLFSALERQISLRSWSIVGLLLTLIWLLSPLGGQSALRLLDQEPIKSTDTFNYLNPMAIGDSSLMGASAANSARSTYTPLFLAALLSSTKYQNTPMDLWGNVKLPTYRSIINTTSIDWKSVPDWNDENVTYASLVGIPVAGVHRTGNSSFNIKTRQWDITCDKNEEVSKEDSQFGNITSSWKLNYTTPDGQYCKEYPCPFSLKSLDNDANFSVASCEMSYEYVEATIWCDRLSCQASSMRKLDLFGDGYTQDSDNFTRHNLVQMEFLLLPSVDIYTASSGSRGSTNAEKWMFDPWNFISDSYANVDLYKVPPPLLAERLTVIWNTFWQSTYATTAIGGNLPQNLTMLSENSPSLTFNATRATIIDDTKQLYKINWRWFTALLVSSIILQIAAYVGLVLKYITLAPDIIGYASSLTLLNPYVPTPTGGTTLHGLERAAILHNLPVRIGDVCANEPVGAIAFAKADEGRVSKLDRRRWYT